jgi:hypothetical protein
VVDGVSRAGIFSMSDMTDDELLAYFTRLADEAKAHTEDDTDPTPRSGTALPQPRGHAAMTSMEWHTDEIAGEYDGPDEPTPDPPDFRLKRINVKITIG